MIKDLQRFFGITQEWLSIYLGISLETLRSINTGRRSYKPEHIMQLHTLREALQLHIPSEQLPKVKVADTLRQKEFDQPLQKHIQRQTRLMRKKEDELEMCNNKYSNLQRGLFACENLLKDGSDSDHHKWLDLRQRDLNHVLIELQKKIAFLEADVEGAKAKIDVLKNQLMTSA